MQFGHDEEILTGALDKVVRSEPPARAPRRPQAMGCRAAFTRRVNCDCNHRYRSPNCRSEPSVTATYNRVSKVPLPPWRPTVWNVSRRQPDLAAIPPTFDL